jgi:RNA polymerase sigma factor for flagellar operon FliA
MNNSELWNKFKTTPDPDLKKQLIINYIKLVHYVIHKSKFANLELLDDRDYFQFGIEGLSEAVDRFKPELGIKFETYAIQRIRGKIIDELRKIQAKQKSNLPGEPAVYYSTLSLNSAYDEEDSIMLYETIPYDSPEPDEEYNKNESKEILENVIKNLPERDRLILSLYYYENLNYREIAKVLNITTSRISQLHSKIIKDLKTKLTYLNV